MVDECIDIVQEPGRKEQELLAIVPATAGLYAVIRPSKKGRVPHRFSGSWNDLTKLIVRVKAYNEKTEIL